MLPVKLFRHFLPARQILCCSSWSRPFSSLTQERAEACRTSTPQQPCHAMKPSLPGSLFTNSYQYLTAPLTNYTSVRTKIRIHYQPSALKRIKKHGLEKRLSTTSQREVLFRRILKGRHQLCIFDRFFNRLPEKRIRRKRADLFDPKIGYKKLQNKPEYYYFDD